MSEPHSEQAPGAPGIDPTWSSSAKEMVGCSLGSSRVWFTIGGGILNEVYYPRVDLPQIRDLGFLVADGAGFWVEVKRLEQHTIALAASGVPAVTIVHRHQRFELTVRVVPCALRDVLLVKLDLHGDPALKLYALLAPHLGGTGHANLAEVASLRGRTMLWAEQGPFGLALAAVDEHQADAWRRASAGYVGASDGWQDFARNGAMSWEYGSAGPGNVALIGELPASATLALGFGSSKESAATLAVSALLEPFEHSWQRQVQEWSAWHEHRASRMHLRPRIITELFDELRTSAMVLRVHQDKTYLGTMVASLSIPWGNTRDEIGGYHLVWPRDLVECAGALLAFGAESEARNTLRYLIATQQADGHWNQNQWVGGKSYWTGLQLDETAFPVLLAVALAERNALDGIEIADMVQRALSYIVRNGPATDQDRWEEDAGLNAFTLAVCVAALVCGAAHLPPAAGELACAVADYWNARIEDWLTAGNTELARRHGVEAYYVRVAPEAIISDPSAIDWALPIRNWRIDPHMRASQQVGVDFLQLVRFGLRAAEDPLILASVRLADELLKADLPTGPSWYRYTSDGYGEHEDGSAFDGSGRGRPWPLLSGERGHYEVSAGGDGMPYLRTMAATASMGGMLPEQVWDGTSVPQLGLFTGHATGSAMPLAWAHAEFIKLAASIEVGRPYDRPQAIWDRYAGRRPPVTRAVWTERAPINQVPTAVPVLIGLRAPGRILWTSDAWRSSHALETADGGLGLHVAQLSTSGLRPGARLELTYQSADGHWAGSNFTIDVVAAREPSLPRAASAAP